MSEQTPTLDHFLAAYKANDNEWWYLSGGDHLNLFDEAIERMRAAESEADAAVRLAEIWHMHQTSLRYGQELQRALLEARKGPGGSARGEVDPESTDGAGGAESLSPLASVMREIFDRLDALEGGKR